MSYWVYLEENGEPVEVAQHAEGGTYCLGGTSRAELNVTYNYGWFYHRFLGEGGLRWLDGKSGKVVSSQLEHAIVQLGTNRFPDYWAPTPGNAGYALSMLLQWAKEHPKAKFRVS